jgi:hypothetical protein
MLIFEEGIEVGGYSNFHICIHIQYMAIYSFCNYEKIKYSSFTLSRVPQIDEGVLVKLWIRKWLLIAVLPLYVITEGWPYTASCLAYPGEWPGRIWFVLWWTNVRNACLAGPCHGRSYSVASRRHLQLLLYCKCTQPSVVIEKKITPVMVSSSKGRVRPRKNGRGRLGPGHSEHMTLIVPPLSGPFSNPTYCCTEAEFSDEIQAKVLRVVLLAIHSRLYSFALRFIFFKLTQPLTVSTVHLLYTLKEKRGRPNRKSYLLPMVLEIHSET